MQTNNITLGWAGPYTVYGEALVMHVCSMYRVTCAAELSVAESGLPSTFLKNS